MGEENRKEKERNRMAEVGVPFPSHGGRGVTTVNWAPVAPQKTPKATPMKKTRAHPREPKGGTSGRKGKRKLPDPPFLRRKREPFLQNGVRIVAKKKKKKVRRWFAAILRGLAGAGPRFRQEKKNNPRRELAKKKKTPCTQRRRFQERGWANTV
ncbi:uncharacterized protein TM35_000121060 [Trypanosoma theileri]|uniref:Uncharacterized protein n=1 Tax=Trypanosoma theileri TaxID=67003 RepID=A0A1X0NXJ6_9TRYP|nr:uncharacterized protein TM35_000121060 [Trypanosoma theileri]ORC89331.1 hypothetical protein TM35_000121060 [Trypanosoma theileri]